MDYTNKMNRKWATAIARLVDVLYYFQVNGHGSHNLLFNGIRIVFVYSKSRGLYLEIEHKV